MVSRSALNYAMLLTTLAFLVPLSRLAAEPDEGPGEVAARWFTAYVTGEVDTVANLSTPDSRELAIQIATMRSKDLESKGMKGKLDVADVEKWLSSMECQTGYSRAYCKPGDAKKYLELHRIHDRWLVHYGEGRRSAVKPDTGPSDSTGPADSSDSAEYQAPEIVAGRWLVAVVENDQDTLREVCTENSLSSTLMYARQGFGDDEPSRARFLESARRQADIMECRVEGDQALCRPEGKEKWINLKRVNGIWKVDFQGFVEVP
ncbi:MAG: hypothetical protein KDK25_01960 [Leptospiraceae bacterium]|nr:hypothetical protein [Leptospiraceae bacterium]